MAQAIKIGHAIVFTEEKLRKINHHLKTMNEELQEDGIMFIIEITEDERKRENNTRYTITTWTKSNKYYPNRGNIYGKDFTINFNSRLNTERKIQERLNYLKTDAEREAEAQQRKRRSNRALENLAKLAEQKAEEAERAKQQAEEERKQRKAEEEERKREEAERAKQQAEAAKQAKKKREQNKRKKTQQPRRSSRLENIKKKQRRESAKITKKKSQLHEEYTEKLKF